VKSDGTAVSHLEYNAFGKLISETKNDNLSFAYTGKLFDKTSDLQWNINRWYDSNVGRWTSEDPIGFAAGDDNLLRYCTNKVTFQFDSLGNIVLLGNNESMPFQPHDDPLELWNSVIKYAVRAPTPDDVLLVKCKRKWRT
jgi:RHS repeat-associated protein